MLLNPFSRNLYNVQTVLYINVDECMTYDTEGNRVCYMNNLNTIECM